MLLAQPQASQTKSDCSLAMLWSPPLVSASALDLALTCFEPAKIPGLGLPHNEGPKVRMVSIRISRGVDTFFGGTELWFARCGVSAATSTLMPRCCHGLGGCGRDLLPCRDYFPHGTASAFIFNPAVIGLCTYTKYRSIQSNSSSAACCPGVWLSVLRLSQ